jgi:hypothetical protein
VAALDTHSTHGTLELHTVSRGTRMCVMIGVAMYTKRHAPNRINHAGGDNSLIGARCGRARRLRLWNYFLINLISARGDKCTRAEAKTIIRGY